MRNSVAFSRMSQGSQCFLLLACSCVLQAAAKPALPQSLLDTHWTAPTGKSIVVGPAGSLQSAIDSARLGDEIVLQAGATFSGNFILRPKPGTGWITIRSSRLSSLPEGTRVSPASAASMAKVLSPNPLPVFATETGAHGYRLAGLEIGVQADVKQNYGLLELGAPPAPSGPGANFRLQDRSAGGGAVDSLPADIVVDRSYVHGTPTCDCKRGVALNGLRQAVVDSYISEIHVHGQDAQAICGWAGPGPFKIVNNYLEGAGENVMFGGAPPDITDLSPSDIEFRHNYVAKPLAWMKSATWTVKNLFELKNASRVLVDSNIFENNWVNAQAGTAILFQGLPSDSGLWAVVKDVTFTNNIVRHSASGIAACGGCLYTTAADPQLPRVIRVYVGNNLFEDINATTFGAGVGGRAVQIYSHASDLEFDHNTILATGYAILLDGDPSPNVSYTNNITAHNDLGIFGSGSGVGMPAIKQYLPNSTITGNLLVGMPLNIQPDKYPRGNRFPGNMNKVGFTNYSGGNGGDYRLAPSSSYRGKGTDGKDPGADIAVLNQAVAGVISGVASTSK